jgi:hypothetical protein
MQGQVAGSGQIVIPRQAIADAKTAMSSARGDKNKQALIKSKLKNYLNMMGYNYQSDPDVLDILQN